MFRVAERERCSTRINGKARTALMTTWGLSEESIAESYEEISITDTVELRKTEQQRWGGDQVSKEGLRSDRKPERRCAC